MFQYGIGVLVNARLRYIENGTVASFSKWTRIGALLALAGCSPNGGEPPAPQTLANPASVHCIDVGGRLEFIKDAQGGTIGMCHLPSGKVCEEWALFRGECL